MSAKRKYEQKKRAESVEETRRRITEATVELHRTVGPIATQISEIAKRAGVQRVTVYNHFPDETSLFAACSAHWRALHPRPNPEQWLEIHDPGERSRTALRQLYSWFRETEPMTANLLRDFEMIPALDPLIRRGLVGYFDEVGAILAQPFRARGRRRQRVEAAARAAADFHFWRALSPMGDEEAAELGARLIKLAADA